MNTIRCQDLWLNMNMAEYEYDMIWIQYDMGPTIFKYIWIQSSMGLAAWRRQLDHQIHARHTWNRDWSALIAFQPVTPVRNRKLPNIEPFGHQSRRDAEVETRQPVRFCLWRLLEAILRLNHTLYTHPATISAQFNTFFLCKVWPEYIWIYPKYIRIQLQKYEYDTLQIRYAPGSLITVWIWIQYAICRIVFVFGQH